MPKADVRRYPAPPPPPPSSAGPYYSYEILAYERAEGQQFLFSTRVIVGANSLSEAIAKAKEMLGDEAGKKVGYWPNSIAEYADLQRRRPA